MKADKASSRRFADPPRLLGYVESHVGCGYRSTRRPQPTPTHNRPQVPPSQTQSSAHQCFKHILQTRSARGAIDQSAPRTCPSDQRSSLQNTRPTKAVESTTPTLPVPPTTLGQRLGNELSHPPVGLGARTAGRFRIGVMPCRTISRTLCALHHCSSPAPA